LDTAAVRVLVVDDYEPWHGFVSTLLRKEPGLEIVGRVFDGLEAVQQAQQLEPDLILLDIGLPTLNGIEAARQIRQVSPKSRILFASENRSLDIVEEAFRRGAGGYVVKSDAASELLPAVEAVLEGKHFVSASLERRDFANAMSEPTSNHPQRIIAPLPPKKVEIRGSHEVAFYPDDASLVDGFARFIETALENGNAVAFIATDSHRASLLQRLKANAVDVDALVEQRRYTSLDVIEALRTVMGSNGLPDPVRCAKALGDLMDDLAKTARMEQRRVAACGEFAPVLLKEGRVEAAIQMEHLTDEFTRNHEIDIFCGYLSSVSPLKENSPVLERICAEHSAIHGLGY
jgi:DNA-binding NarL/FixJ family response regulator